MEPPEEVRARLERAGQGHLLRFWAELDPAQCAELLAALPPGLGEHCRLAAACARPRERLERLDGRVEPLPAAVLGSVRHCGPAALQRWEDEGERAGGYRRRGQRTRGSEGPQAVPVGAHRPGEAWSLKPLGFGEAARPQLLLRLAGRCCQGGLASTAPAQRSAANSAVCP